MRLLALAALLMLGAPPAFAGNKAERPLALADSVARVGQWGMAARIYREATVANPADAAGWAGLGRMLIEGGAPADGLAALRRAETIAPKTPGLHHLIGRAAIALGTPVAAETAFQAAVTDMPADARAWTGLGTALDLLGRHADAQAAYARALAIDPLSVAARNNAALSHALDGRIAEARTELAALAASSPRARANLALLDAAGPPSALDVK